MRFKKISDKQIQCMLSQEELEEKGMGIEDFLEHRDKTEAFLRELVNKAQQVLDMDDMGHYFSVQLNILNTGHIAITINLDGDDGYSSDMGSMESFAERLRQYKQALETVKKSLEDAADDEENTEADMGYEADEDDEVESESIGATPGTLSNEVIFWHMLSMDECIRLSRTMRNSDKIHSSLYKYDDEYYMEIRFDDDTRHIAGQLLIASEYVYEMFTPEDGGNFITEHGNCIIKDNAIEILASLDS